MFPGGYLTWLFRLCSGMYPDTQRSTRVLKCLFRSYLGIYPTKHTLAVFVQLLHVPGYQNWLFQSCLGMYPGIPTVYLDTKTGCFGHTWVCPRVSLEATRYTLLHNPRYFSTLVPFLHVPGYPQIIPGYQYWLFRSYLGLYLDIPRVSILVVSVIFGFVPGYPQSTRVPKLVVLVIFG